MIGRVSKMADFRGRGGSISVSYGGLENMDIGVYGRYGRHGRHWI